MMRSSVSTAALWAAIIAVLAAVGGWGAFFLVSERAVATEQAQLRELRELRAHKAELVKVVHDQQAKTAELAELDRKLRGLQENLDRTREAQERAQGALGQQIAQTREEQARAEQKAAEQTASIEKATPSPRKKRYLRKAKRGKRNGRA
jgi:hypothetical protein